MKKPSGTLSFANNLKLIIDEIDCTVEERSLLKHPFYTMWTEGKLTMDHLRGYSKEYFQLVKTVPKFVENIYVNAGAELSGHTGDLDIETQDYRTKYLANIKDVLDEECQHIEPWINFARSLNLTRNEIIQYKGTNEVNEAIDKLAKLCSSSFVNGVVVMYSFEKEIPKISSTKIDGLKCFYGISNDQDINYFKLHETADIKHARLWKNIITDSKIYNLKKEGPRTNEMVSTAVESLQLQNTILDSVYEKYVSS